MTRSYANSTCV